MQYSGINGFLNQNNAPSSVLQPQCLDLPNITFPMTEPDPFSWNSFASSQYSCLDAGLGTALESCADYNLASSSPVSALGSSIDNSTQYSMFDKETATSIAFQPQSTGEHHVNGQEASMPIFKDTAKPGNKQDIQEYHNQFQGLPVIYPDINTGNAAVSRKSENSYQAIGSRHSTGQRDTTLIAKTRGGRRAKLTADQAKRQTQARLLGVCIRCRMSRIKV